MDRLEQLCTERGLRLTEHRRIVLQVLEAAIDYPCAREIHRRAAADHRIGLATIYRTLNFLAQAGVVVRRDFGDGKARYERADAERHDRLIDVHSGKVVKFHDMDLDRLIGGVAERLGYRLVDYRLELFGECRVGESASP